MSDGPKQTREELDAGACYILSKRQGVPFIAFMLGKPEEEVKRLIALGKSLAEKQKPVC